MKPKVYREFRGIDGLVAAKVIKDDSSGYETGPVFDVAGVAKMSIQKNASSTTHFYDNQPAVIISATGADNVSINVSAIADDVLAEILGQSYDTATGAYIEGDRKFNYYAIGYKSKLTDGTVYYAWRYKGVFNSPDEDMDTEDDGTDANGQTLVYTGIKTTYKFATPTQGVLDSAKSMRIIPGDGLVPQETVNAFFDKVTTPDDILGTSAEYTLFLVEGADTTLTVKDSQDNTLANGAVLEKDDVITITVTGGTVTVNGTPFTSGGTYTVGSDVRIVSTKTSS